MQNSCLWATATLNIAFINIKLMLPKRHMNSKVKSGHASCHYTVIHGMYLYVWEHAQKIHTMRQSDPWLPVTSENKNSIIVINMHVQLSYNLQPNLIQIRFPIPFSNDFWRNRLQQFYSQTNWLMFLNTPGHNVKHYKERLPLYLKRLLNPCRACFDVLCYK